MAQQTDTSKSLTVLVVDDDPDGREMLVEYLEFRGFTVSSAETGEEAIAVAFASKPDVVLMDLQMPGIGGWEATRQLKANSATHMTVVVAVTAHSFSAQIDAARDAGCDKVIAKPYDLAALGDSLARVTKDGLTAFDVVGLTLPHDPQRRSIS
jgi:CheY-like chemotaxis protein